MERALKDDPFIRDSSMPGGSCGASGLASFMVMSVPAFFFFFPKLLMMTRVIRFVG